MTETVTLDVDGEQRTVEKGTLLEALYNLNKHAKKYARLGDENYRKGKKATAKKNSVRKQALYELKRRVVEALARAGEPDRVEVHEIDGSEFYCHYVGEWSYHTPVDKWTGPTPEVAEGDELEDFSSSEEKERSDMSLKAALTVINNEVGLSANDYLPQERIQYGYESYFAGWSYLD